MYSHAKNEIQEEEKEGFMPPNRPFLLPFWYDLNVPQKKDDWIRYLLQSSFQDQTSPSTSKSIQRITEQIEHFPQDFYYPSLIESPNFKQIHSVELVNLSKSYAEKRLNNFSIILPWYRHSCKILHTQMDVCMQKKFGNDYYVKAQQKDNGDLEAIIILTQSHENKSLILDDIQKNLKESFIDEDDHAIDVRRIQYKTNLFDYLEIEADGVILTWKLVQNLQQLPNYHFEKLNEPSFSVQFRLLTDCFLFYVGQDQHLSLGRQSLPIDIYPFLVSKFLDNLQNQKNTSPLSNNTQETSLLEDLFEYYSSEDVLIDKLYAARNELESLWIYYHQHSTTIDDNRLVPGNALIFQCEQLLNLMKKCCSVLIQSNLMGSEKLVY